MSPFQSNKNLAHPLWGERTGVNDQLLTSTATPLILLPGPPSVSHCSKFSPRIHKHLSLKTFVSLHAFSCALALTYKSCHTCHLSVRNPRLGYLYFDLHFHGSVWFAGRERRKKTLRVCLRRQCEFQLYFLCCYGRQHLSCRRTFPIEIDLLLLIRLPLNQWSCINEEAGVCSPYMMTWSSVKWLLVFGLILFDHSLKKESRGARS